MSRETNYPNGPRARFNPEQTPKPETAVGRATVTAPGRARMRPPERVIGPAQVNKEEYEVRFGPVRPNGDDLRYI